MVSLLASMGWANGLLLVASAAGLGTVITVAVSDFLSVESWEKRAIRKRRRKRRNALKFLRSTASRDHFNEFQWRNFQ